MKIDDNEISLEMRSNVVPTNISGELMVVVVVIMVII